MFPKFVVFEGIDGSGKSTHASATVEMLKNRGVPTVLTSEPTRDGVIGGLIRRILTKEIEPPRGDSMALLFEADRLDHKHRIRDWMDNGFTVVCDRYEMSTIAYQASWCSDDDEEFRSDAGRKRSFLRRIQRQYPLPPDLTFVLNIPVEDALQRLGKRKNLELYEASHALESAARFYRTAADAASNHVYIDGRQPIETVQEVIAKEVGNLWANW